MDGKLDPSTVETVAAVGSAPSLISSSTAGEDDGRFVPGTLLGGRYRIIGLLGRGGMGEVYRATDLTLGQSVALKFLPESAAGNQQVLERFAGEVRVARQVSHPNVCRVYDIGEIDGSPFISMEYVDGEDLSSLLLRIGRLPADKALETARKLCAGLAAAHDRGVIHRDLKPQNIMMNRRGQVVVMDFGLAAIADHLTGAEARNGTPAYMAPEQLKGAEVTARSDIFALGLVLYELFTGKKPYDASSVQQLLDQQEAAHLTSMTSIAADIDPAVERIIRRCLDPDPSRRPSSPLSVAAALPGGDPLAAALAAGETPSPELVAASGATHGLETKYSVPLLALICLCVCAVPAIRQSRYAMMQSRFDDPPEVLAQKSRDIASSFGYPKRPADTAIGLDNRWNLLNYLRDMPAPMRWNAWLESEAPVMASYRESLSPLTAAPEAMVTADNPAPIEPGMITARVDAHGLLREFSAVPYLGADAIQPIPAENVFRAAGLDLANFHEVTSTLVPRSGADRVMAWAGPHPAIPNTNLTVEIAWWKGRVTEAAVEFPWYRPGAAETASTFVKIRDVFIPVSECIGAFFAMLLARRNWLRDRADRAGAARIAVACFLLAGIAWAGQMHPVPNKEMASMTLAAASDWLTSAVILWLVYLAIEPTLRSRWPHSIVTWNRLLAGQWTDAQLGAHVLIGAAVGSGILIAFEVIAYFQAPALLRPGFGIDQLLGTRQWIGEYAGLTKNALQVGLVAFFAIFGLRMLLRKEWLAAIAASVFFTVAEGDVANAGDWATALVYVAAYGTLVFVLLRVGLVASITTIFFINGPNHICLGADWKMWYAPYGLATIALMLGIAVFAFWRSLGSRELLSEPGSRIGLKSGSHG